MQYTGPIEAWEVRDQNTGDVKCSIDIKAPLKACLDENASAGSNSYAIYGVWPGGLWGPKRFSISGLRPFSNFTLWLVTCSGSNPKRCLLQAPPVETSTLPASKY